MLTLPYQENNIQTAKLHLGERRSRILSIAEPSYIMIHNQHSLDRHLCTDFIEKIYREKYQADIKVDYPFLMCLHDAKHRILAAVGFRYAKNSPLFLEHYTKKPINEILQAPRAQIVEIGSLASAGKGASAFLFTALASYLSHQQIKFAAITGTDYLHKYFKRAGLKPQKICDANIADIADDSQNWGTYYQTNPRVLVGSVDNGVTYLRRILGAKFEECLDMPQPSFH